MRYQKNLKYIFLLLTLASLNPPKIQATQDIREFQKQVFYEPSADEKSEIRATKQKLLDNLLQGEDLLLYGNMVSFQAVESLSEVSQTLGDLLQDKHYLFFLDLDETILFSGSLGWIRIYIDEIYRTDLMLEVYGFEDHDKFVQWGERNFSHLKMGNKPFYHYKTVLDSNVPDILKNWYNQNGDIYVLTYRPPSNREKTTATLNESNIYLSQLNRIQIQQEAPIYVDRGVIYTAHKKKYGENSAAIKFLEMYLEKIKDSKPFELEIISVDNSDEIARQVARKDNLEAMKALEEKFNCKIHLRFYQPYEENWQSPESVPYDVNSFREIDICDSCQIFLDTFKGKPIQCKSTRKKMEHIGNAS